MKTLILSLILASVGFILWRVAMESGQQSAMTRTPPELTEHTLGIDGKPMCAKGPNGECLCELKPQPFDGPGFGTISADAMAQIQAAGLK